MTIRQRFTRALLGNISLVCLVGGFFLLATSDLKLVENGRLTDLACYLILGLIALLTIAVGLLDYGVRHGAIDQSKLPRWLRDEDDQCGR